VNQGTSQDSASSIKLGPTSSTSGFTLPQLFFDNMRWTGVDLKPFASKFQGGSALTAAPTPGQAPPSVDSSNLLVSSSGEYLETCQGNPRIGCIRIKYSKSAPAEVSVIGDVTAQHSIQKMNTPASWGCSASTFHALHDGAASKESVLEGFTSSNDMIVWLLRIVGSLGAWIAVYCILSPVTWCADKVGDVAGCIPCIGDFLEGAIEGIATAIVCMMSCSCGLSCSFFVIALTWLYMRPLYGAIFLLISCGCFGIFAYGGYTVSQNRKQKKGGSDAESAEAE